MRQGRVVDYHYPVDDHLSLVSVSGNQSEAQTERDSRDDPLVRILAYPFDDPVYVVYAGQRPTQLAEYERIKQRADNQVRSLEEDDRVIAIRLLRLLNIVRKQSDTTVSAYKDIELDAVGDATINVEWGNALPVVAGQLASNLILRHPLPNANHRTGIAMLELCIESMVQSFEMPRTHVSDEEWKPWANMYITESKRYLTVRRNSVRFAHLADLGVDAVRRKGGIEIVLDQFTLDLSMYEAWEHYARLHEELWVGFAEEAITRGLGYEYLDIDGPTKDSFAEYISTEVSEDDLEQVF